MTTRTIFPVAARKIAWMVLVLRSLNVKAFDDVRGCCSCLEETCHRPPREETERLQRRGEKERRQSAVGHSLHIKATFCFLLLESVWEQPERESQMSAWYVSDSCSSRLAGMDYERTHGFCLMCFIHILAYICDVLVKRCTCTSSIHVDGCRTTVWT